MVAQVERNIWDKVREEYELGNYKTLKELAERNDVDYDCLRQRMFREDWKEALVTRNNEFSQKIVEVKEDLAKDYLSRTYKRALRYEKIIDESQKALSTTNEGVPLLDVDAIMAYSKAELNIHALAKSALRISDKLDVTSGGKDIGSSFVEAIAKMRESKDLPKLTQADLDNVMEAEIID